MSGSTRRFTSSVAPWATLPRARDWWRRYRVVGTGSSRRSMSVHRGEARPPREPPPPAQTQAAPVGRGDGTCGRAPTGGEHRGTARSPAGSSRSHTNSVNRGAPARKPLGRLRAGILCRGHDRGARHEARQDRRARELQVISHTSAMHFKGTRETLPDRSAAARRRGDRRSRSAVGDRVRVTAQLIEASTDRHLWAETYERDLRDVLGLQDDIARAITNASRSGSHPRSRVRWRVPPPAGRPRGV